MYYKKNNFRENPNYSIKSLLTEITLKSIEWCIKSFLSKVSYFAILRCTWIDVASKILYKQQEWKHWY